MTDDRGTTRAKSRTSTLNAFYRQKSGDGRAAVWGLEL
eukprot:COSAG02_NODE_10433_length_1941_cov_1.907166_1_plen_37_part_10